MELHCGENVLTGVNSSDVTLYCCGNSRSYNLGVNDRICHLSIVSGDNCFHAVLPNLLTLAVIDANVHGIIKNSPLLRSLHGAKLKHLETVVSTQKKNTTAERSQWFQVKKVILSHEEYYEAGSFCTDLPLTAQKICNLWNANEIVIDSQMFMQSLLPWDDSIIRSEHHSNAALLPRQIRRLTMPSSATGIATMIPWLESVTVKNPRYWPVIALDSRLDSFVVDDGRLTDIARCTREQLLTFAGNSFGYAVLLWETLRTNLKRRRQASQPFLDLYFPRDLHSVILQYY